MRMNRRFGFIHEKLEIKILILFILRRLPEPIPLDELTQLIICDDGISYFEYMECLAELVKTEHLQLQNDKYSITEKGKRNGEMTEDKLPYSIRMYVENTTLMHRNDKERDAMISTQHTANPDGTYTVILSMSDGLGEIISLSLFAMSEPQALEMEKGIRDRAEGIYNTIIEMLLK